MGKLTLRRRKSKSKMLLQAAAPAPAPAPMMMMNNSNSNSNSNKMVVVKKKAGGSRLWMRMDRLGDSEVMECDKTVIIKRVSIPSRDFRILGPIFSLSSSILARDKAMIVNLELVRAIVTSDEVLLLDPLRQETVPFVDQLRRKLQQKNPSTLAVTQTEAGEDPQDELPFEFQVLEIALEVVCKYLDTSVAELEREAYPVLDDLAINVSTKNLEHVRILKSNLTRLLAKVQKVRDELEHLLDDNEDMAQLYLTRKRIQNQQLEALSVSLASNSRFPGTPNLRRFSSTRSGGSLSNFLNENDVEDLEMLLEAYFMQLDGIRNKILSVREYIDDTEDYVNIQLGSQRNELIQLQLVITIAAFAIAFETAVAGIFGMNIPYTWDETDGVFWPAVAVMTAVSVLIFFVILGYAKWKKLLGS